MKDNNTERVNELVDTGLQQMRQDEEYHNQVEFMETFGIGIGRPSMQPSENGSNDSD